MRAILVGEQGGHAVQHAYWEDIEGGRRLRVYSGESVRILRVHDQRANLVCLAFQFIFAPHGAGLESP